MKAGTLPPFPLSTLLDMDAPGIVIEVRRGVGALNEITRILNKGQA